jgi:hypothetical protein
LTGKAPKAYGLGTVQGGSEVATISDFLLELAKPKSEESDVRDLWHARDREDAMDAFGLEDFQKDVIRRALDSEDLTEVKDVCSSETQGQAGVHVFLWVK